MEVALGAGMIYALISMQICGLCAGLMGQLNSIRSGCQLKTSELSRIFIRFKWIVIISMTVAVTLFVGIMIGEFIETASAAPSVPRAGLFSTSIGDMAFSEYCFFVGSLLDVFFYFRLKHAWKRTQDEFFKFE